MECFPGGGGPCCGVLDLCRDRVGSVRPVFGGGDSRQSVSRCCSERGAGGKGKNFAELRFVGLTLPGLIGTVVVYSDELFAVCVLHHCFSGNVSLCHLCGSGTGGAAGASDKRLSHSVRRKKKSDLI